MKKKIYCFDFDGTLTTSDTLLEFIKYAKGRGRFLMVFLMYSPVLVMMKLHMYHLMHSAVASLKKASICSARKASP